MATKPGVAHTTIAIPFDLKRRMDQVGQCVNWSEVACRAFESWLDDAAGADRAIGVRAIEGQDAKLPSHDLLWAAVGATGVSLLLLNARQMPVNPLVRRLAFVAVLTGLCSRFANTWRYRTYAGNQYRSP